MREFDSSADGECVTGSRLIIVPLFEWTSRLLPIPSLIDEKEERKKKRQKNKWEKGCLSYMKSGMYK